MTGRSCLARSALNIVTDWGWRTKADLEVDMSTTPTASAARILVIEDDVAIRDLVAISLGAAGFHVQPTGTIAEARSCLEAEKFDLLIVDVRLPDGNGIAFAQEIVQLSTAGVIIMTGGGDEIDRIVGLELGADDYIDKPFHQRELVARARAVLRRLMVKPDQSEPHDSDIRFHGYTLCKSARTLVDPTGASVALTTMEFDVLAVLAENKNVVMQRSAIFNDAGFRGSDPGRVIDGLISRLRKKLVQSDGSPLHIRTVHGRGYTLSE